MHKLVEIAGNKFDVIYDLRYATENNVTGQAFYSKAACYLHEDAADKLGRAIELASSIGLGFKIFDAFRPIEAQQFLWDCIKNPEFISNPDSGSCPHCRGVAVDLTLVNQNGVELYMGTEFDDFSSLSHHANTEIPAEAQRNRFILMGIMTASGWDNYMNEWWHYQLFNVRNYPLLSDKEAKTGLMAANNI